MTRAQNIVLVVVAAIVGFSVLAYNLAGWAFPAAVSVPDSSNLESRTYEGMPSPSADTVLSGGFQASFEKCLSDHVPARDRVMLFNAALQRASVAASAAAYGYDIYPTFFGSRYYVVPRDGLVIERAEQQPADGGGETLDAWVNTLNAAAQQHPDMHFVYDCVARHDQTEANPTYRFLNDRLNPAWVQEHLVDRLHPRMNAFVDPVASYDEIVSEWFATDPHWTLERALKSYNLVAERLSLATYAYDDAVTAVDSWYGGYAKSGLDLDVSTTLEDLPLDFSQLSFSYLPEDGGGHKQMGMRDAVLFENAPVSIDAPSMYYEYFGGGSAEAVNSGPNNGKTALFVGDSLSYCLARFIAANYERTVFLLPGNSHFSASLESYLQHYRPDDVIVMTHATKYQSIAEYSPAFVGLDR